MKLVTFQSGEAFEILKKAGVLRVDESKIDFPRYERPYNFIVKSMLSRCIKPAAGQGYPLWAWAKCGAHIGPKKIPNKTHKVQNKVKITFEKKDSDVLISDYMAYSFILSGQIVPKTRAEYEHFEQELIRLGISKDALKAWVRGQDNSKIPAPKIEATWKNIFDLKSNVYQCCFWELKLDEIIRVDKLEDRDYLYGSMNAVRADGTRPDWKQKYMRFLR
ncbi:MAG: DUF3841 domain-containing protein [Alphaproteobacteria bacterium]|nr:DUF3841 domain-containing protein [Alphaproteobacteria bacterium]